MLEFLAIIGFGAIVYFGINYYEKVKRDKSNLTEELNDKIKTLKFYHPTFREVFSSFEKDQHSLDSEDDDLVANKGFYTKIFDIVIYVQSHYAAESFKNKVLLTLKSFESTEEGKKEIDNIIFKNKVYEKKRDKISKYLLLELEKNHIAYSNELKNVFPADKNFELNKSEFIKKLKTITEFKDIDDELVYKKFTNPQTGLICYFHNDTYLFDTKYEFQIKNTRNQTYDDLNRDIVNKIMSESDP